MLINRALFGTVICVLFFSPLKTYNLLFSQLIQQKQYLTVFRNNPLIGWLAQNACISPHIHSCSFTQKVINDDGSHYKQQMELTNAISLEGFLWKQSPGVIKIYQKRYFAIRNNGQFIVWFGKKPSTIDIQPKGIIITIKIQAIKAEDFDDRIFTINYNNRWFILRAETKEGRDRWVRSITTIMDHLKKTLKTKLLQIKSKPTDWKFENASEQVVKSIRIENEKLILKEGEDGLLQKSGKQLMSIIGFDATSDIEKCITFGFLSRKGFIGSQQKWYFIYSEFNLSDQRDDAFNDKIKPFFERINAGSKKKQVDTKKEESDSESSQEEKEKREISKHQVNFLYEYDLKTNAMSQQINLTDVITFTKDITQNPFLLKISYGIFDEKDVDAEQVVKEIILQSEYMSEIQKWHKALQIIFQRYSIPKIREALLEKRFQKFQIKMAKINDDTDWRIVGNTAKPEYVYVNQQTIKLIGHLFPIEDINKDLITCKMSILFKENPTDEGVQKQASTLTIFFKEGKRLELAFENKQALKTIKKKLKKYMKIRSSARQSRGAIQLQKKENNEDTYLIDKKIRQASSSIKVNFYDMMEQEVPKARQQKQPKPQSFLDKFMSIFCGPPKQEDILYF